MTTAGLSRLKSPNPPPAPAQLAPQDAAAVVDRQTAIMEMIAGGAALPDVLAAVATAIAERLPGTHCSILLLEAGGTTLHPGAAPTLPPAYSAAVDGIAIGPSSGSCGTAAYLGREVVAEDVALDARWDDYRHLALPHGLRSCWSVPIRGAGGIVGTFAVYHGEPHRPDQRERALVDRFAHLASVAIDHHRLYGALAESEDRFRRAFEDNVVGMALTDLDGRLLKVNRALLGMLGRSELDTLGHGVAALVVPAEDRHGPGDLSALLADLTAPAPTRPGAEGEGVHVEGWTRRPDGQGVRVAIAASAVRDADGVPVRLGLNIVDVTQRWEAAQERRARERAEVARHAAEEASRAKTAFVSALSHELRTPLQAITGFTELLGSLDLTPGQRRDALAHIDGATRHILSLVDDVLDLARVEAGAMPVRLERVEVAPVVLEVLDLLQPMADERDVVLSGRGGTPPVCADRRRLQQVLLNIVGNAIRYNVRGGTVLVTWRADDSAVLLNVSDTGPGIPADRLQRLFVPFERLGADEGAEAGAGLGMGLARGITEAMDGELEVTSVVGAGTTVSLRLPRYR